MRFAIFTKEDVGKKYERHAQDNKGYHCNSVSAEAAEMRCCVACKLKIMLSRALFFFIFGRTRNVIARFSRSCSVARETVYADIIDYANVPSSDASLAYVRNRGEHDSSLQEWTTAEANDKHTFLRAYGERTHLCKVISLARHAHVHNRGEAKERFRAATTRYRPTRGQTRAGDQSRKLTFDGAPAIFL